MTGPCARSTSIAYLARPDVAATKPPAGRVPATPRASPRFYNWALTWGRRDLIDTAFGNHARAGRQSVVPRLDASTFIGHPPIKEPHNLHLLVPGSGVEHDCATVGVAD